MSPTLAANMKATAEAFIMDFDGKWEADATMKYRAHECVQSMLPSSNGIRPQSNEEFAARFQTIRELIPEAKMVINDYLAVPEERRAVVLSAADAMTAVGPFHNEYVWYLTFNEDGDKITKITEFYDSKAAADFLKKCKDAGLA